MLNLAYHSSAFKSANAACVCGFVAALFLSQSATADVVNGSTAGASSFELDTELLDTLQFSRVEEEDLHLSDEYDLRTELSFKLRPKLPKFSRKGAFGLKLFDQPRVEVSQSSARDLFFGEAIPADG